MNLQVWGDSTVILYSLEYTAREVRILDLFQVEVVQEEFLIYKKLNEFLEARDVTGIEVLDSFDEVSFLVVRENEYVKTTHEFIYFPGRLNESRVFFDCYTTHDHTRILANPKFKKLIDSIGYEFLHCSEAISAAIGVMCSHLLMSWT